MQGNSIAPNSVKAARERRADLHAAMVAFEWNLASPAGKTAEWNAGVAGALADVRVAIEAHVAEVEAPEGLFADMLAEAPHLRHAVDQLRADHDRLRRLAASTDAALHQGVEATRTAAVELLSALSRHRHRGADFVYEAFNVDVSTGD